MSSLAKTLIAGAGLVLLVLSVERFTRPVPARPDAGAVHASLPAGVPTMSWFDATPISETPGPAVPHDTLTQRIQRLMAEGGPESALLAYWQIRACMDGGAGVMPVPPRVPAQAAAAPSAQECADLNETHKRDRLAYLDRALQANVRGAAVAALREGPFGDWSALQTRPDDPLVREWQRKVSTALMAQAEQGDALSMSVAAADGAATRYLPDIGPERALAYMLALARMDPQMSHFDVLADLQKESMSVLQIEAAEKEAERIVANSKAAQR